MQRIGGDIGEKGKKGEPNCAVQDVETSGRNRKIYKLVFPKKKWKSLPIQEKERGGKFVHGIFGWWWEFGIGGQRERNTVGGGKNGKKKTW